MKSSFVTSILTVFFYIGPVNCTLARKKPGLMKGLPLKFRFMPPLASSTMLGSSSDRFVETSSSVAFLDKVKSRSSEILQSKGKYTFERAVPPLKSNFFLNELDVMP